MLVKVPGIGLKSAYKIISARRYGALNYCDLLKMKISLNRARHFITVNVKYDGLKKENDVKNSLLQIENESQITQLSMFSNFENSLQVITGEIWNDICLTKAL